MSINLEAVKDRNMVNYVRCLYSIRFFYIFIPDVDEADDDLYDLFTSFNEDSPYEKALELLDEIARDYLMIVLQYPKLFFVTETKDLRYWFDRYLYYVLDRKACLRLDLPNRLDKRGLPYVIKNKARKLTQEESDILEGAWCTYVLLN